MAGPDHNLERDLERDLEQDLERRLRGAETEELHDLLHRYAAEMDVREAVHALRNPFLGREGIETVAEQGRLLASYEVKRLIALHPRTPEPLALRFVPSLFWRDLLEMGVDTRVRPTVRRAADRRLMGRLSSLATGEKMAVARRASGRILSRLRHDPSPRVAGALLENPRITEGILVPLVASDDAQPKVLELVARNRRWGVRYEVRLALCCNPRTPVRTVLPILPMLRKRDLRTVAREIRLPAAVRRRAKVLLGEAD
ncbi:MAG: hypothetical protein PVG07_03660 [Acidobacteriota bacterium]|jgi:hypothetical protein